MRWWLSVLAATLILLVAAVAGGGPPDDPPGTTLHDIKWQRVIVDSVVYGLHAEGKLRRDIFYGYPRTWSVCCKGRAKFYESDVVAITPTDRDEPPLWHIELGEVGAR